MVRGASLGTGVDMGLLGDFEDPKTQGLLSLGLGLLNSRGNFGQGLGQAGMQAMDVMRQAKQDQQRTAQLKQQQAMQAIQMQAAQQQLAEQQRAAAEAEAQRGRDEQFRSAIPEPVGQSMAQGPTEFGNFNLAGPADPRQMMLWQAMKNRQIKPMEWFAATQKDNAPFKLAKDEKMFEAGTNRVIAENPGAPDLPSAVREYEYAKGQGFGGTFQDFVLQQKKAGATNISVPVNMLGEREYAKDQGKQYSEMMASLNKAGFTAPTQIRKLERMEQLLAGVDGGKLAPAGVEVASMANSLGIKMDPRLGNKEAAQALSRDMAGGLRQPGTGPMTDKDFDNFLLQIPDLSKSAQGRAQITATMKAALHRDIQVSKMAREYERKNGRIDGVFLDEVAQYIAENPVVGSPQGWKVKKVGD